MSGFFLSLSIYRAEYRPGRPNVEHCIRLMNIEPNIDLEGRI